MTPAPHPTPNLWIGPGIIEGEVPAGMVLQRESGAPCAIGDVYDVPAEYLDRDIAAHGGGRA